MTLPDFLRSDDFGEIFLAGHRITLYHLIKDYQDGSPAEAIAAAHQTLSLALVQKVFAFYLENQPELERYAAETRAEIERRAAAPARGPSLADLKRRLAAKQYAVPRVVTR